MECIPDVGYKGSELWKRLLFSLHVGLLDELAISRVGLAISRHYLQRENHFPGTT